MGSYLGTFPEESGIQHKADRSAAAEEEEEEEETREVHAGNSSPPRDGTHGPYSDRQTEVSVRGGLEVLAGRLTAANVRSDRWSTLSRRIRSREKERTPPTYGAHAA